MQWADQCFGGIYRFMQYTHKRRLALQWLVNSLLNSKSYIMCIYVNFRSFFSYRQLMYDAELQQNLK